MTLEQRFEKTLKRLNVLNNTVCILALSGGGDSVALTHLAAELIKTRSFTLHAIRVTHGIRTGNEEQAERNLCTKLCRELNIPFQDISLPPGEVESIKKRLNCGMEQAARHARRTVLEEYGERIGADCILSGHTADDQLETVLMRLFGSSGPEGLKGIPERNGRWIRPLLSERRTVLRQWLMEHRILWAEDSTNRSGQFRRNRIRNELIPLIADIMPGWEKGTLSLAGRSWEITQALQAFQQQAIPVTWVREGTPKAVARWSSTAWDTVPDYLKAMTLWEILNRLESSDIPDRRISWSFITNARRVFDESGHWSGLGVQIRRNGDECTAFPMDTMAGEVRIVIQFSDITESEGIWQVSVGPWRVWVSSMPMENSRSFSIGSDSWPLMLHISDNSDGKPPRLQLWGRNQRLPEIHNTVNPDDTLFIRVEILY